MGTSVPEERLTGVSVPEERLAGLGGVSVLRPLAGARGCLQSPTMVLPKARGPQVPPRPQRNGNSSRLPSGSLFVLY